MAIGLGATTRSGRKRVMSGAVTVSKYGVVALATIDNPPVNALSHPVRVGLLQAVDAAMADPAIAALVLICAGRTFVAGADIREFNSGMQPPFMSAVTAAIEGASKPVIAAIHGTALGGGLELAMCCHFRVAVASARVGLPEVKLGILPGAGGTQRLPRLVGVEAALRMITSGDDISAAEAQEVGLIDAVVDDLKAGALAFAGKLIAEARPIRRTRDLPVVLEDPGVFDRYRTIVAARQPGYEAPPVCIDSVRLAVDLPFDDGLRGEYALCMELMRGAQSQALRHVFAAERIAAKIPGVTETVVPRMIETIAVIGKQAPAIAHCFAAVGIPVTHQIGDADLVIEAAPEEIAVKEAVFLQFEAAAKPGAILATTSPDIDLLAGTISRPQDVVGLHFSDDPAATRMLEVMQGAATGLDALAGVIKIGRAIKKAPVPVKSGSGFVGPRLAAALTRQIAILEADGIPRARIDGALGAFGFPLPGSLADPDIVERCLCAVIDAGAQLLEVGIVARPQDIDMLWITGYGFPPYRGGPMYYADRIGLETVYQAIVKHRDFEASPLLRRLAEAGKGFYDA